MFERNVQTAYHFRSRLKKRLRLGLINFVNVAAEMVDQFPEFLPNILGMRPRIF